MVWATPKPASGLPASGIPAKGAGVAVADRVEPGQHGQVVTLGHGARSPRVYGTLATALAAGLMDDRPDLAVYPEAVAAWATAEAQAALMRRHLDEVGALDDDGQPRTPVLEWLNRTENAAMRHRATLGLDPMSEARLARERASASVLASAVDLDALAERGRAALAAREASGLPATRDLAGEALTAVRASAPPVVRSPDFRRHDVPSADGGQP